MTGKIKNTSPITRIIVYNINNLWPLFFQVVVIEAPACLNESTKIREKPNVREKQVTKKFWEAPNKPDWNFGAFWKREEESERAWKAYAVVNEFTTDDVERICNNYEYIGVIMT